MEGRASPAPAGDDDRRSIENKDPRPPARSGLVLWSGGIGCVCRLRWLRGFGSLRRFRVFGWFVILGRFLRPLRQYTQERIRVFRSLNVSRQGRAKGDHSSVELAGRVLVLLDDCSREADACKSSARA